MADNTGNGGPGNLMVLMPTHANSTLTYWTTPDGVTFTARSLVIGNNANVFGIVWTQDATGPCWLMGINYTGSLHTFFKRSSDGINWTNTGEPTNNAVGTSLASPGDSRVLMTYLDSSDGGPSSSAYSIDGGATWYQGVMGFTSNNPAADAPYKVFDVAVASSNNFMAFNSKWLRFSATAGLLPSALP
jgi:hypothetical protein